MPAFPGSSAFASVATNENIVVGLVFAAGALLIYHDFQESFSCRVAPRRIKSPWNLPSDKGACRALRGGRSSAVHHPSQEETFRGESSSAKD